MSPYYGPKQKDDGIAVTRYRAWTLPVTSATNAGNDRRNWRSVSDSCHAPSRAAHVRRDCFRPVLIVSTLVFCFLCLLLLLVDLKYDCCLRLAWRSRFHLLQDAGVTDVCFLFIFCPLNSLYTIPGEDVAYFKRVFDLSPTQHLCGFVATRSRVIN